VPRTLTPIDPAITHLPCKYRRGCAGVGRFYYAVPVRSRGGRPVTRSTTVCATCAATIRAVYARTVEAPTAEPKGA